MWNMLIVSLNYEVEEMLLGRKKKKIIVNRKYLVMRLYA